MASLILVSGLLFYHICLVFTAGPQCFECSSTPRLEFCDYFTQCEEGEKCYVQKIRTHNGHDQYKSGCVNNRSCSLDMNFHGSFGELSPYGQLTCVECCDGDMCNNQGCRDTGPPPRESRGPYCYQCQHMPDPSYCERLTICDSNEVCTIDETVSFGHQFSSGCRRKGECLHEGLLVGRDIDNLTRSFQLCHKCCSDDFCNQDCQDHHQQEVVFWSAWSPWGTCSAHTCGSHGHQIRNRSCTNVKGDITSQGCEGVPREERHCSGCVELYNNGERTSGIYTIAPAGHKPLDVVCDMTDGGGWTVLQHRLYGSVSFNRSWTDYVTGFGDLRGDFWLGLDNIHILTSRGVHVIIDMTTKAGELVRYSYDHFQVKNESTSYELSVSGDTSVNCTDGERLLYNNGYRFATPDRPDAHNCSIHGSGWWFSYCSYFNINGIIDLSNLNYGMTVGCPLVSLLNETLMKVR
ncbi:SCO-spondin-like [Mizuhopecten yessoensis]|uniref:SCO-spondin-like n=1 Tax=Mizuhopecten yessoensis TaxID=6573 RepID=UPI000B45905B|nr:SCO-spondin-like [Mizuhopecten yessoensis]